MDEYNYAFENRQHYSDFIKNVCKTRNLVVKFSAQWCEPCNIIHDYCMDRFSQQDTTNTVCIIVDIDESDDVFSFLKQRKMLQGIPTLYLYRKRKDNYIPDESISGTNIIELDYFFNLI